MSSDKEKYMELISNISSNRNGLKNLLEDVEKFDVTFENILKPTDNDYRKRGSNISVAGEKIKTAVDLIKSKLDIRKSIDASVKLEIDLRRQIEKDINKEDEENTINVRELFEQLKKEELDSNNKNS